MAARKTGHKYGFDRPGAAVGHGNAAGLSAKKALDVPAVRVVKIEDPGALALDTTGKAKAVTPGEPHVVAVPAG